MTEKRLIVCADDFGLSKEVNQGILHAYQHGIVTSASLIASGEAFEDACRASEAHPDLDLGAHLTLVETRPLLAPEEVPTLVTSNGFFRSSVWRFARDYYLGRVNISEVENELRAQLDKLIAAGIAPSHLDSHQHVHLLPDILAIMIRLAETYDVPTIRSPFEPLRLRDLGHPTRFGRVLSQATMNLWFRGSQARLMEFTHTHFRGFMDTGRLDHPRLEAIFDTLPTGTTELICHPRAEGSQTIAGKSLSINAREVDALSAPETRALLETQKIILTTFRGLPSS